MRKKLISLVLAVVMAVHIMPVLAASDKYTVKTLLYSEDFENYEGKSEEEQMKFYESTGSITVETVGSTKALYIKNINGISNAVAEKSIKKIEERPVHATLKFMQRKTGSSQNKVLELYDGTETVIIYAKEGSLYLGETKLCEYSANKWYTVELDIDLFNGKAEAVVNGETKASNYETALRGIDKIAFCAAESPGFYIDDIKLESEQTMSQMNIEGSAVAVIPKNGETTYDFSARFRDENGVEMTVSDIDWSYAPEDYAGISSQTTASGVRLTVTPQAPEGTITLKAMFDDGAYSVTKEVKLEQVSTDGILIDGDVRIGGKNGKTYLYGYKVVMHDQNGEEVEDYGDFRWSMTGLDGYEIPSSIKLNESTGIITVTADTPFREFIELKATSADDETAFAKKKILVTEIDSLLLDNARYEAVKTHIDNVFEYAKDPYDEDSPLLADLVNVHSKAPGVTLLGNYEAEISSNLGAQSSLMRSMVNLSNFENNDKYTDKVRDIYKYNNDLTSGLPYLYAGGHIEIDLKTKAPNAYNQTKFQKIYESKGGYLWYTPFYWVDPERAEILQKEIFTGHAAGADPGPGVRWNNLQFSRHYEPSKMTPEIAEMLWLDTESYDRERKGAVMGVSECQFLIAYSEMFSLLTDYYKNVDEEEKERAVEWGHLVYTSLDQTGYDPITGKYTGMFNETNGSKYHDDWSDIYGTWEKWGRYWYNSTNAKNYVPGDRWFSNVILGDRDFLTEGFGPSSDGKSWVNNHYDPDPYKGVNEDNWMYFLEPYMFTRENSCIVSVAPGLFKFCDILEDNDPIKTEIIEKYCNSIYNYLNLRYNWETSHFDAKMSWGLDVTGWEYPHAGYYSSMGSGPITGKIPETELVEQLAKLVKESLDLAERTNPDELANNTAALNGENVKLKDQLNEQAHYIWSVLRNLCQNNFMLGDIGDPFTGEPTNLNMATTGTNSNLLRGVMALYRSFGDESFLKLASNIANNIMASKWTDGNGVFAASGNRQTTISNIILPTFLELEAILLDDYDRLITEETYGNVREFWDQYLVDEHGVVERAIMDNVLSRPNEKSVQQRMLIIEDAFSMEVGQSRKIEYKVLPYDAGTGVIWDVSDPEIADISDSGVITAHKRGTVDIRCVSSSVKGLASETITVTVK